MNIKEAIVKELSNGEKTIWELEVKLKKLLGECPDKIFSYLRSLEKRGVVERVYSKEKKTFLWRLKNAV